MNEQAAQLIKAHFNNPNIYAVASLEQFERDVLSHFEQDQHPEIVKAAIDWLYYRELKAKPDESLDQSQIRLSMLSGFKDHLQNYYHSLVSEASIFKVGNSIENKAENSSQTSETNKKTSKHTPATSQTVVYSKFQRTLIVWLLDKHLRLCHSQEKNTSLSMLLSALSGTGQHDFANKLSMLATATNEFPHASPKQNLKDYKAIRPLFVRLQQMSIVDEIDQKIKKLETDIRNGAK